MIEVKKVSKQLKGRQILDQISLNFEKGKIYGLKGRNGAGKTMLMRAIAGLIRVDGEIIIDGKKLGVEIDFPENLGILIENAGVLPDFTLMKNLKLLAKIRKVATDADIAEAIKRVGLEPSEKRKIRQYSLGMKQRANIAQAIFEKPDLLLLDEPTNAIDEKGVAMIRELLLTEKARGATIIIASHNEEDLKILTDEIIYMEDGRLVKNE
ncbi:MAG: ATP-binding cassette domain-containing protein [Streptococcaceae bacterium]|jgi:ABC-2 type transport system ATP-binding protein|nr:ATP-binding cassette domain-containing protein [Streptococcaceae bacterium]